MTFDQVKDFVRSSCRIKGGILQAKMPKEFLTEKQAISIATELQIHLLYSRAEARWVFQQCQVRSQRNWRQ